MKPPALTRPMLTFVCYDQHGPLGVRKVPAPVAADYVVTDRPEWWVLLRSYELPDGRPLRTWILALALLAPVFALLVTHL